MAKEKHPRKRAPKPVLTPKARAYQKHILQHILHSPWFWSSIVFSIIFLAVFLASTVEAGIRYQSYVNTGNAFNTAWVKAENTLDGNNPKYTFQLANPEQKGKDLDYWFSSQTLPAGYTGQVVKHNYVISVNPQPNTTVTATASGGKLTGQALVVATLPILKTKSFSDPANHNADTFYETNLFFAPFWGSELVVADDNIWDWLAVPLFGEYPYQVKSLERGKEVPNADIYRCLVYYYSYDKPDVDINLSFLASLWPTSMNMNYGYWIISATFFSAFAFSFCTFCAHLMKLRKTFKSDKKDNENTLAQYLEAEADNMHFQFNEQSSTKSDQAPIGDNSNGNLAFGKGGGHGVPSAN